MKLLSHIARRSPVFPCRYPPIVPFFIVMAVFILTETAFGLDYRFGWEVFEGLFKETNYLDYPAAPASPETAPIDETYSIMGLYPDIRFDFGEHFNARGQAGFEWTHSWDAADSDDWDAEVLGATIGYASASLAADMGVQPLRAGRGLIAFGDEPGAAVAWKGWDRVVIKGETFQVLDTSPLAVLSVSYSPGFLETIEIFGAGFHDADNAMTGLFTPFFKNIDVTADGDLYWIGGMADMFMGKAYASGIVMGQWGEVDIHLPARGRRSDLSSFLADVEISYPVLEELSISAFMFITSGDSHPMDEDLTVFISPMPFNDRTMIFFNGGFSRYDVEESMTLGGVTWDGAAAPGLGLDYQPWDDVFIKLTAALLFPEDDAFRMDNGYGWEADARLAYEFYPDQQVFLDAGMLTYGDYWKDRLGYRPDPSLRGVGGIHVFF